MSSPQSEDTAHDPATFSPTGRGGYLVYCGCGAQLPVAGDYQAAYAAWAQHVREAEVVEEVSDEIEPERKP